MLEPIVVLALMVFSEYFPLFDFSSFITVFQSNLHVRDSVPDGSIKLPWQFGHVLFFAVFFTPVSHCPVKRVELVVVHSIPASLPGHAAQAALHSSSS